MSSSGFEPAIPAIERPQTHALDREATGIESNNNNNNNNNRNYNTGGIYRKQGRSSNTDYHNVNSALLQTARRL